MCQGKRICWSAGWLEELGLCRLKVEPSLFGPEHGFLTQIVLTVVHLRHGRSRPFMHVGDPETVVQCNYCLFHSTQASNLTPSPPKMSSAVPIVKSTFPPLRVLTKSRSSSRLPPPAYVTGMVHHWLSLLTSSSSMPCCSPSLSAA